MNVEHLDRLFQEYGYDVKEKTTSYRVYLLNQGMYHGAESYLFKGFFNTQTTVNDINRRYSEFAANQSNIRY